MKLEKCISSGAFLALLALLPLHLEAAACIAGTDFHWSSDVYRLGGNDVWSFGSGYVEGYYWAYWRPRVTSTQRLNGNVLFGRQGVVSTAGYGGQALNEWHDTPQTTGTGVYSIDNHIEYLPREGCDPISDIYSYESLQVERPTISGINAIWWLGGGSDPNNGYYNQATLAADPKGAPETPYWTVAPGSTKISLSCTSCTQNVVTSKQPSSGCVYDIGIKVSVGGLDSDVFVFTVNEPSWLYKYRSEEDSKYDDGWKSLIHYRTVDHCNWTMPSIALNEKFGSWWPDQGNNWNKPTAGGLSEYAGYNWFDEMFFHLCGSSCNPAPTAPQTPLSTQKVDHASQEWRIGSSNVGSGVHVQTNTHQRYIDHGRHN